MPYYAKSKNAAGKQPTNKEHLQSVADLAFQYGQPFDCGDAAKLAGLLHDFGKYSDLFQSVLEGRASNVDHAMPGAAFLNQITRERSAYQPVIEAINGHHDGLVGYDHICGQLRQIVKSSGTVDGNAGKRASMSCVVQIQLAADALRADFPKLSIPKLEKQTGTELETMLYTRMLFSCLVDADYSASAQNDDDTYLENAENAEFDADALLDALYQYRETIRSNSDADRQLNQYRDEVFERCGEAGKETEGLFTLTAPTGTGKTLALLHFALQHCKMHHKRRIIIVLPFLTLAEQNAKTYAKIIPSVLVDHSQSDLPEQARELAARWSTPVIITTSVRFFEALFADRPTACRKLHNIANSVVLFDEAQSLPTDLTSSTLQAVNALCRKYHTTMVFSTATQPDYSAIRGLAWQPKEILPDHERMYRALQRVGVEWRTDRETALEDIAREMSLRNNVCTIVNLRRHARELAIVLEAMCPEEPVFYLTTDLCPAHRNEVVRTIKKRQKKHLPCRVIATQCIEAGVDLDFDVLYRALAPLDAIIQAAGRCNRNGRSELGLVVVFCPEDNRMPYPDDWYRNAAIKVLEMNPPFSIHDTENIRRYYQALFADAKDRKSLQDAIAGRDFSKTARAYRLIENRGAQVIVPFSGEEERYERVSASLYAAGVSKAAMKEAAPIMVTSFAKNLREFAEMIPYVGRNGEKEESNIYLLRRQYLELYSDCLGLQLPQEEKFDGIF